MDDNAEGASAAYTARLVELQTVWWKRLLPVQAPYRWNLRRLRLGFVLDLGCGIGRNLVNLGGGGVGVDYDAVSVRIARERGLEAYLAEEFTASARNAPGTFDTLLLSHVAEHMTRAEVTDLVRPYLPLVRPGGRVVFITPQERGFASDPTHVEFLDFTALGDLVGRLGLVERRAFSFPFPRALGKLFVYNEFVVIAEIPPPASG